MTKYTGIIIGTYHAGKNAQHHSDILRLPIPQPTKFKFDLYDEIDNVEIYKHVEFHWRNNKINKDWKYGFWVPTKIEHPEPYILEVLTNAYSKN